MCCLLYIILKSVALLRAWIEPPLSLVSGLLIVFRWSNAVCEISSNACRKGLVHPRDETSLIVIIFSQFRPWTTQEAHRDTQADPCDVNRESHSRNAVYIEYIDE